MSSYGTVPVWHGAVSSKRAQAKHYEEEKVMKKTFKQRLKDWLFDSSSENAMTGGITIDEESIQLTRDKSIRFEIHNASGGRIVQTRRYDNQKDRHIENLYIITSEMDFGREIDKIITMEALR